MGVQVYIYPKKLLRNIEPILLSTGLRVSRLNAGRPFGVELSTSIQERGRHHGVGFQLEDENRRHATFVVDLDSEKDAAYFRYNESGYIAYIRAGGQSKADRWGLRPMIERCLLAAGMFGHSRTTTSLYLLPGVSSERQKIWYTWLKARLHARLSIERLAYSSFGEANKIVADEHQWLKLFTGRTFEHPTRPAEYAAFYAALGNGLSPTRRELLGDVENYFVEAGGIRIATGKAAGYRKNNGP